MSTDAVSTATTKEGALAGRGRRRTREWAKHALLLGLVALVFYPFVMLLVLSLKNNAQFYHNPWLLTFPFHWGNYAAAFLGLVRYMGNSILVSGASAAGVIGLSAFSAYVFARFEFFGRQFLFYAIISLMMIPSILGLVPLFMIVRNLGLIDSYWALILPYIAGGQVMGIFLLRTFFAAMPGDLFDAAKIDGAGDFRAFSSVALPLAKPMLAVIAVITVQGTWNDIIWPYVALSTDAKKTLTIGLLAFQGKFVAESMTQWGPLFAGYVVASLPLLILFLSASRTFVEGLTSGALKA